MSGPSVPIALGAGAAGIVLVMALTAAVTWRTGRAAYVDAAWGAGFVAAAWAALVSVMVVGAPLWRAWLLVGLVTLWGLRLSVHLGRRVSSSTHDDPRYEDFLDGAVGQVPFRRVLVKVFGLQTMLVIAVSLPVTVGVVRPVTAAWVVLTGSVLWLIGVVIEAVADAQLAAYRADPDRPAVLATGLWSWSRHPNYFGDFCVWWGIWLIGGAASGLHVGILTIIAPLVMSWILIGVSGVRLAERRMQTRPGWSAYSARTSVFVPLPPRRKLPIR